MYTHIKIKFQRTAFYKSVSPTTHSTNLHLDIKALVS